MRFTSFASLTLFIPLAACMNRGGTSEGAAAELAADSADVSLDEGNFMAASLEGAPTAGFAPATAEDVAAWIADHAGTRFVPAGCATSSVSGTTVTLTFADCTGPRGRSVDGVVTIAVQPAVDGSVTAIATATDLMLGNATVDLDATAVYTAGSVAVTTSTTGTGPLGNPIEHHGDYTVTWDDSCASIDGAWSTSSGDRARSTTASVERCVDMCPTGTVTRDTIDHRTITVTFDGTATASWTSSTGRSGTFELACGL